MSIINASEILNLIREVGQPIALVTQGESIPAQPDYGIPAQLQTQTRAIRGYVVPEKARWVPGLGQPVSSGNWTAYIAATDLT